MKILKANQLSKSYGEKVLFKDLNLTVTEKDKIGLIGINGSGKSHLLASIYNVEDADTGNIVKPQDYTIGYLPQEINFPNNSTIIDIIFMGQSPILKAIRTYNQALYNLEKNYTDKNQQYFHDAELLMTKEQAWNVETEAKIILNKLGIENIYEKFGNLSGGQQKRVGLAQVLIQEPDLLLLDEPTNHLDYQTIQWLEEYLNHYKNALIVITHDRYFLNTVTNKILELDNGILSEYNGNYEHYLSEKAIKEENLEIQNNKKQKLYKQELQWIRAGVKARGTKQQARKDRFKELENDLKNQGTNNNSMDTLQFNQQRLGKKVIELKDVSLTIGNKTLFTHFNYLLKNTDRIGIIGANGLGKSSLLNIIDGITPISNGEIIIGPTVKIGYYKQNNMDLDENKRIINYLSEIANTIEYGNQKISISELLERFLFPRYMHGTLIKKLSGGEKRRLYLLSILLHQPNVLLLDEPTNDLDISTLTILEDYLNQMQGTVIIVSHDRYFLDKTVNDLWILKDQKITTYHGNVSNYLNSQLENVNNQKQQNKKEINNSENKKSTNTKKLTYKEQKEWENIEQELNNLDEHIQEIQNEMQNCGDDYVKLGDLQKQLDDLNQELDQKLDRFDYLESIISNKKC